MPQPDPNYRRFPSLYVYNTQTRRHVLKTSKVHKADIAAHPELYIETSTIYSPPPGTTVTQLPLPPTREIPVPGPHVGQPIPPPVLTFSEPREDPVARQHVRALIQNEVKQNPSKYVDRSAEEMSQLFRQMLIEKLAGDQSGKAKAKSAAKEKPKPKKSLFKVRKPQTSEDEEEDMAFSDEES